jgi:hypothetical protein
MQINHYSKFEQGNASEYIKPGKSIDITSHGMGSGIYGVSKKCVDKSPPSFHTYHSVFDIERPYHLTTTENCDDYIEVSKTMMRALEEMRGDGEPDFSSIAEKIVGMIECYELPRLENIEESLKEFWIDYNTRTGFVEMPINYVLKKNGFDGVCSTPGTFCDRWCKGYVKFIPYPGQGNIPVGLILNRHGINKDEFRI